MNIKLCDLCKKDNAKTNSFPIFQRSPYKIDLCNDCNPKVTELFTVLDNYDKDKLIYILDRFKERL